MGVTRTAQDASAPALHHLPPQRPEARERPRRWSDEPTGKPPLGYFGCREPRSPASVGKDPVPGWTWAEDSGLAKKRKEKARRVTSSNPSLPPGPSPSPPHRCRRPPSQSRTKLLRPARLPRRNRYARPDQLARNVNAKLRRLRADGRGDKSDGERADNVGEAVARVAQPWWQVGDGDSAGRRRRGLGSWRTASQARAVGRQGLRCVSEAGMAGAVGER